MKIVNRGYILVSYQKAYTAWVSTFDNDEELGESNEANVYLTDEDFIEDDLLIEQNFKKIFKTELSMITDNENDWPEKLNRETFDSFFTCQTGTTVFDIHKSDLKTYKD